MTAEHLISYQIQAFYTITSFHKTCGLQTARVDLLCRVCACTLQLPGVNVCKIMNMKQDVSERGKDEGGKQTCSVKPSLNK